MSRDIAWYIPQSDITPQNGNLVYTVHAGYNGGLTDIFEKLVKLSATIDLIGAIQPALSFRQVVGGGKPDVSFPVVTSRDRLLITGQDFNKFKNAYTQKAFASINKPAEAVDGPQLPPADGRTERVEYKILPEANLSVAFDEAQAVARKLEEPVLLRFVSQTRTDPWECWVDKDSEYWRVEQSWRSYRNSPHVLKAPAPAAM